ncbi:MAG TPA: M20/M25/M40 family metallo-hydrolase, partial [Solirubrobacterales bacterium]|nr:M20/M25/M40 family metallo-hydrolase [Solirubrobacterales bacterium]
EGPAPVGVELVLTVAEEQGLRGAKAFDASQLRSRAGLVLDHAGAVGEVVVSTPTQQRILADFIGVEAHAGIKPEDGSNAIAAAAAAIARMDLGRLDEETTANVGLITGGTSGNVVPGHCAIHAEARSLDAERAAAVAGTIADACAWGASEHGCDVDVRIEELFRGYRVPKDSAALALAEQGLRAAGLEPRRVAIGGGSDANVFRLDGFDCLLLSNGTADVHTSDERVPAKALDKMLEVCEQILAAAAEPPAGE